MDEDKLDKLGYELGYLLGSVSVLCVTAAVIGITVKFLFWLF